MSREDLALVLGGFKTLHYFDTSLPLRHGEVIYFTHGIGHEKIRVPVIIDATSAVLPEKKLNATELRDAARHITGEYQPIGSSNTARNQLRRARLEQEPPLPQQILAQDMAGRQAIRPQEIRFHVGIATRMRLRLERDERYHLRHAYTQLAPAIKEAHQYEFPVFRDPITGKDVTSLPPPPEDMSMIRAVRIMHQHMGTYSLNDILKQLALPGRVVGRREPLTSSEKNSDEHADGVGALAQLLTAYPTVKAPLGVGIMAAMGTSKRLVSPAPLQGRHMKDGRMLTTIRALQKNQRVAAEANYSFELPVVVPEQEPLTELAKDISDALAQECGYKNAKALRSFMGINENENPLLHFYTYTQALPKDLPEYEAKAGKRHIERMHDAWDAWESSGDASVEYVRGHVASLPEVERIAALKAIANRRLHPEIDPHAPAPLQKANGNGALPADVQKLWELLAAGGSNSAAMHIGNHTMDQGPKPSMSGDGWAVLTPKRPSAERYGRRDNGEHTNDIAQTEPQPNGTHVGEQKTPNTKVAGPKQLSKPYRVRKLSLKESDIAVEDPSVIVRINGRREVALPKAISDGTDSVEFFYERKDDTLNAEPKVLTSGPNTPAKLEEVAIVPRHVRPPITSPRRLEALEKRRATMKALRERQKAEQEQEGGEGQSR